jgi:hypothetical protein
MMLESCYQGISNLKQATYRDIGVPYSMIQAKSCDRDEMSDLSIAAMPLAIVSGSPGLFVVAAAPWTTPSLANCSSFLISLSTRPFISPVLPANILILSSLQPLS